MLEWTKTILGEYLAFTDVPSGINDHKLRFKVFESYTGKWPARVYLSFSESAIGVADTMGGAKQLCNEYLKRFKEGQQ